MLTISESLQILTQIAFLALGILSLLDYLRSRAPVHRDIALMFGSLAIVVILNPLESLLNLPAELVDVVGLLVLTAQPFLLIRLLKYFQEIPTLLRIGVPAAMVVLWIGTIVVGSSLPVYFVIAILIYFVAVDGYALVAFFRGAINKSGVVQQRLRFAAAGSGLLALALAWAGAGFIFPTLEMLTDPLVQLTAIASAVTFYLGLATPQRLRQTWQLSELYQFLLQLMAHSRSETEAEVFDTLGHAALEATGGNKALVLLRDEEEARWLLHESGAAAGYEPVDLPAEFEAYWQDGSSVAVPVGTLSPPLYDALQPGAAALMYVVPLVRQTRAWGVLLVFLEYGSLFVADDLELIQLFAEQSAMVLENLELVAQQRRYAETLEEQVEVRTAELMRRNTHISLLQEISRSANEATSIEESLQKSVDLICKALNFSLGHVYMPSEDSPDVFKSTSIWYSDSFEKYKAFCTATENTTFTPQQGTPQHGTPQQGIIEQVMQEARVYWHTHIAERSNFTRAEAAQKAGIETGLFAPILVMNQSVAVLELFSEQVMSVDDEIVNLMSQIGAQLGRIIERQRTARLMRESEARFRTIANAAPLPLVITRLRDNKILYANHMATEMFGLPPEEFIGRSSPEFYVKPAERRMLLHELSENGSVYDHEVQMRRPSDGSLFWASVTMQSVTFEGENALFASLIDVTESRAAQLAVQESEKRFRSTFEQAAVGIAHVARPGRFIRINERFCDIVGYTPDELHEMTFQDITHPDDLDTDLPQIRQLIRRSIEYYAIEKRYIRPDGSQIWGNLTVSLVLNEHGRPDYFIAVLEDISERKRLANELQRLNQELEQRVQERTAHLHAINQELEAFSYSVSHDLRSPLRAVDGFSQALLEDYEDAFDEIGQDFLHRIRSESQRMGRLIDDLLALSRYSRTEMHRTTVNLSQLVRELIAELQAVEPDRNVTLSIQDDIQVSGDERLLRVVLQNLVGNAWKFTGKEPHAHIEFGAIENNGLQEYYVRDNGAGFNMDYLPKLFGAFQRLHSMTEFEGTGIGLATVQRIIHRHGGAVRAEGAVNEGATFYFSLEQNPLQVQHEYTSTSIQED